MSKALGQSQSFIGIDLGTSTGFARCDKARRAIFTSQTWDLKPTRFDSPAMRYVKFKTRLREQLALGATLVFYEKVMRHMGTAAAHAYGAFLFSLHETCDDYAVPYLGLTVQEIKMFATGKGNAKKDAMMAAALKLGFKPSSEDEADAIAILKCGMETKI